MHDGVAKRAHAFVIFDAGRFFKARTGIHTPGLGLFDGASNVSCIESAGDYDFLGQPFGARPIEGRAGSTVQVIARCVEQERLHQLVIHMRRQRPICL